MILGQLIPLDDHKNIFDGYLFGCVWSLEEPGTVFYSQDGKTDLISVGDFYYSNPITSDIPSYYKLFNKFNERVKLK